MKEPKFKAKDIVSNNFETRVILFTKNDYYFFVNHDTLPEWKGLMYNPTKSALGITFMDKKFKKVGELDTRTYKRLLTLVEKVSRLHNEAFELFAKGAKKIDITKFLNPF